VIVGRSAPSGHIAVLHPDVARGEDVARLLRATGHRVSLIERGRRVVQAVVERSPDLFLVSLDYPDPPIPALVRGVRQALPDLPIVLLKGPTDPGFLVEADEVVREPLDPSELDIRVGALLRAQAERRHLDRKVQELLGLYKISWAFSLSASPEALYGHLARQSAEALRSSKGLVLLFERERRQMVGRHQAFGFEGDQVDRARYNVDGEVSSRWNFRKNGPLLSNKAQADSRLLPELVAELGIHSVLIAPMSTGSEVLGLILVADRPGGAPFVEEDLSLLLAVAGQARVAVENLRLHEELKRANTLLKDYDRAKSEFVGIVAHDFRRPLMAIRGFAELVLEEPDIPLEARQDFMRTVIAETEQLALLANDTLLITQIETGLLTFNWSEVDLGPFVLDTIPMGLSDHSVLLDIPPNFPPIVADPGRLRQVITNLTMNAVKYSPGGGSITVRCRDRGGQHVVIEVIDHGLGIPSDQVGQLFQKFARVRSDEHLRISGTGLGLYICRLIVEGHGGQIWVESEEGKGSTFGIVLPVDARAAQKTRAKAEPQVPQLDT
jgi:signal transduction histidine kinase/DNA-binding response OmpR family regulator